MCINTPFFPRTPHCCMKSVANGWWLVVDELSISFFCVSSLTVSGVLLHNQVRRHLMDATRDGNCILSEAAVVEEGNGWAVRVDDDREKRNVLRVATGAFGQVPVMERKVEALRCPCPPEVISLKRENERLMTYVDVLRRKHAEQLAALRQEQAKLVAAEQGVMRRHMDEQRSEVLQALERAQDENSAMRERLIALEEQLKQRDAVENRLRSALSDNERTKREGDQSGANKAKAEHLKLVQTVSDLETALRAVVAERNEALAQSLVVRPGAHQADAKRIAALELEVAEWRARCHDKHELCETLKSTVDDLQRDVKQREIQVSETTRLLQHEVAAERQRSASAIALYAAQVEELHTQLSATFEKNRMLVSQNARLRSAHVVQSRMGTLESD